MISKVRIKNFKSIIDLELDFNSLKTILVGQNEAGKSSILEALEAFELCDSDIDNINYECENIGNFKQEISVQYQKNEFEVVDFNEALSKEIISIIKNTNPSLQLSRLEFSFDKLAKIENFELTRVFEFKNGDLEESFHLDKSTLRKIIGATVSQILETTDGNNAIDFDVEEILMSNVVNKELAEMFHTYCPEIVFFNDFFDILPDKIEVQKLYDNSRIEGKSAAKNIEKILGCSFKDLSNQKVRIKRTNTEKASNDISVDFLMDWNQKIDENNQLKIEFDIEKNSSGIDEIHFFIETKEGVKLEPRKRSQGLRWFLSLWLEIKAESKNSSMILLFDEPGAHLHINAMKDMMNLFDKLCSKGNQIIYTTHLPSMIDTNNLENLRLVIHDKTKGTLIEKLTASKFNTQNKRDALQPIAQAIGMRPMTEFSVFRQKNVLLEGYSDMLYFNSMKKLLEKPDDYAFIPGVGVSGQKMHTLVSFCIGYGLEWLIVLDNGDNPDKFIEQLQKSIFDEDSTEKLNKIHKTDAKEIEDLFENEDIILLGINFENTKTKSISDRIGKRKILFATQFNSLVENGTITKEKLSTESVKRFSHIFDWISNEFSNRKK